MDENEKPQEEQPDRAGEERPESVAADVGNPPLPWMPRQGLWPRDPVPTYPNGRWAHWTDWL